MLARGECRLVRPGNRLRKQARHRQRLDRFHLDPDATRMIGRIPRHFGYSAHPQKSPGLRPVRAVLITMGLRQCGHFGTAGSTGSGGAATLGFRVEALRLRTGASTGLLGSVGGGRATGSHCRSIAFIAPRKVRAHRVRACASERVLRTMSGPLTTSAPWCRGRRAKVKMIAAARQRLSVTMWRAGASIPPLGRPRNGPLRAASHDCWSDRVQGLTFGVDTADTRGSCCVLAMLCYTFKATRDILCLSGRGLVNACEFAGNPDRKNLPGF